MKNKQIILTVAFLFTIFLIKAQDKNQYMSIEFNQSLKQEIQISIDGTKYIEEKADYSPDEKAFHNLNPFFKKIKEYEATGWELMYINTLGPFGDPRLLIPIAYLKKKKLEDK